MTVRSFALCRIANAPVAVFTLPLSLESQQAIEGVIAECRPHFISDSLTEVDFDPTFRADGEHIVVIRDFGLPQEIASAIETPEEQPELPKGDSVRSVKSIFHISHDGEIYFQCWRNFDLFGRKRLFNFLEGGTFQLSEEMPLIIERKLDAVLQSGDLYFRSFANTSSILDMMDYVTEATSDDLEKFSSASFIAVPDGVDLLSISTANKRRIRAIVNKGLLDRVSFDELKEKAGEVNYQLPIEGDRLVIPGSARGLSDLLNFLNERFYTGPISGESFLSTSSRPRN